MAPAQNEQAEPPSRAASRQSSSGPERSNSSIWSLFGSKSRSKGKVANLGEKSTMYYHPELKRWVEKGKEHEAEQEAVAAEPPKIAPVLATTSTPGSRKPLSARYVSNFPTSGSTNSLPEVASSSKPSLGVSASGTSLVPVPRAPASVGSLGGTPKFFVPQAPASTNSSSTNLFSQHHRTASTSSQQQDASRGSSDPGSMQDSMHVQGNSEPATSQNCLHGPSEEAAKDSLVFATHAGEQRAAAQQEQITPADMHQPSQPSSPPHGFSLASPVMSSSPRQHHSKHRPGMPPPAPKSVPGTRIHHHADHHHHHHHDQHEDVNTSLHSPRVPSDSQVSRSNSNLAEHLAALKAAVRGGKSGAGVKIPAAPRSTPHPGRQDDSPLDPDLEQIMHPGVRHKLDGPLPWELPDELKYSNEFISVCANWQRDNPDTEYSPDMLRAKYGARSICSEPADTAQVVEQDAAAVGDNALDGSKELSFSMPHVSSQTVEQLPQATGSYSSTGALAFGEPSLPQALAAISAPAYSYAGSPGAARAGEPSAMDAPGSGSDAAFQGWPGYGSVAPLEQLHTGHVGSPRAGTQAQHDANGVQCAADAAAPAGIPAAAEPGSAGAAAAAPADAWPEQRHWGSADGSGAGHMPMSPRTPEQGNSEPADRHADSVLGTEQPQQQSTWADIHITPQPQWPVDAEGGLGLDAEGGMQAPVQDPTDTSDAVVTSTTYAAAQHVANLDGSVNTAAVMDLSEEEHAQYAAWLQSWTTTVTRLSEDPEYNLTQEYAMWHQQYLYWDQRIPGLQQHMQQYQAQQQTGTAAADTPAGEAGADVEVQSQDVSLAGGVPEQQHVTVGGSHAEHAAGAPFGMADTSAAQPDVAADLYEHEQQQQQHSHADAEPSLGSPVSVAADTAQQVVEGTFYQPDSSITGQLQAQLEEVELIGGTAAPQGDLSQHVDVISEQLVTETLDQVLAEEVTAAAAMAHFMPEPSVSAVSEVVSETALHMSVRPGQPGEPPVRTMELSEAVEDNIGDIHLAAASSTAWHEHQQLQTSQHESSGPQPHVHGEDSVAAAVLEFQPEAQAQSGVDSTLAANAEWYISWLLSQVSAGQQLPSGLTYSMQQLLQLLHDPSLCAALGIMPAATQVPDSNGHGVVVTPADDQTQADVGKSGKAQPHAAAVVAANGWYHAAGADELQVHSCAGDAEVTADGTCDGREHAQHKQHHVQHATSDVPAEVLEDAVAKRTAELQAAFDAQLAERVAAEQAAAEERVAAAEASFQQQLIAVEARMQEQSAAALAERDARVAAMEVELAQRLEAEVQIRVDAAQQAVAMQHEVELSQMAAKVTELQQELAVLQAQCEEQQSDMNDLTVCVGMETEKVEALKEALLAAGMDPDAITAPIEEQHMLRSMETEAAGEEGEGQGEMEEAGEGSGVAQLVEVGEGEEGGMEASSGAVTPAPPPTEQHAHLVSDEPILVEDAAVQPAEPAQQHSHKVEQVAGDQADVSVLEVTQSEELPAAAQQDADMDAASADTDMSVTEAADTAPPAPQVEVVEEVVLTGSAAADGWGMDTAAAAAAAWDGAVVEPAASEAAGFELHHDASAFQDVATASPRHQPYHLDAVNAAFQSAAFAHAPVVVEDVDGAAVQGSGFSEPVSAQPASGRFGAAVADASDLTELDGWEGQGDGWGQEGWEGGGIDEEGSAATALLV